MNPASELLITRAWSTVRQLFNRLRPVLPALVAVTLTLGVVLAAMSELLRPSDEEFQKRGAAALEAGHPKEAVIWLRRYVANKPLAMESRLQLVEAYRALDNPQATLRVLSQIAPLDRVVYGPAHLYLARLLMEPGATNPQRREMAKLSLDLARKADPRKGQGAVDIEVSAALMAELLMHDGDWDGVVAAVAEISEPSPATRMLMAMALKQLGRLPEAVAAADDAVDDLNADIPGNSAEDRLRRASVLGQASLVKNEPDAAVEVVMAAGEGSRFRALQASVIRQAAITCRTGGNQGSDRWLKYIIRGLAAVPDDLDLTTELMTGAAYWSSQPGFTARAAGALKESGHHGHFLLLSGISLLQANQVDEALTRFERAREMVPGNPIISNNLAVLLAARKTDGAPARALAIIDEVLEKHPDIPAFQDSKGQILLRLGRLDEAVRFLEEALRGAAFPATHLALSQAYSRLGKQDLAETHRKLGAAK